MSLVSVPVRVRPWLAYLYTSNLSPSSDIS